MTAAGPRGDPGPTDPDAEAPRVDFVGGKLGHRFRHGEARAHALVKAVGIRGGRMPTVADATAGLGRDAFLLASAGARVTLFERSAPVHALLRDALARAAAASPEHAAVVARMALVEGDAREHLGRLRPDVVVVDPMHPPRANSALVKRELRLLGRIVGADPDAASLLEAALAAARERVVLKWPLRAAPLIASRAPSHQFLGKTVRYDVFVTGAGKG